MKLVLSLSEKKQMWALSNPEEARSYISYGKEKGVQKTILIFTGQNRGPREIELDEYPRWAKRMILSSIVTGELINTGEEIGKDYLKIKKQTEIKSIVSKKKKTVKPRNKSHKKKG